jgi:hypothetical protein
VVQIRLRFGSLALREMRTTLFCRAVSQVRSILGKKQSPRDLKGGQTRGGPSLEMEKQVRDSEPFPALESTESWCVVYL